ncbi:MAG TPA: hypothetical protein ENH62_02720 [Marinobacter sp.]|uniref:Uncharacterized protein n=1 Tax=marine sediment metagenome TaxID=412755 RepID=A0A0F9TP45_9ZZZZ|nr:hypothetical protein [Marinobacter sp.]HEC61446.1 hypothetical protein [bacterium]
MDAVLLASIAGVVLSLGFSYVPKLAPWYEKLGKRNGTDNGLRKRLVMLGLLILTSVGVYGLACMGWGIEFGLELECGRAGVFELARALILAVMANQSTYQITPKKISRIG